MSVAYYTFLFNGSVQKNFGCKELAYHHAFQNGYESIEMSGFVLTTV